MYKTGLLFIIKLYDMKPTIFIIILIQLLVSSWSYGQQQKDEFWNDELREIADPISNSKWIKFKNDANVPSEGFFESQGRKLGLSSNDQMQLVRSRRDETGMEHQRYQQYHKGLLVENSQFILHARDGRVELANGKLAKDLRIEKAGISEMAALPVALTAVGPSARLQEGKEGDLIITDINAGTSKEARYVSAYKFIVQEGELSSEFYYVYVDAQSGSLLQKASTKRDVCDPKVGTAETLYNGIRSIGTDRHYYTHLHNPPCSCYLFRLKDCNRAIETHYEYDVGTWEIQYDGDNYWQTHKEYTQAHWGATMTFDYFSNVHYWEGVDDNYKLLEIRVHGASPADNSQYGLANDVIYTGSGGTASYGPWVSLDVIAHEFTHGVAKYAMGNTGTAVTGEWAAIDEGLCDIFASMTEHYTIGGSRIYYLGEDFAIAGNLRNMTDPNNSGFREQPDTYEEDHWDFGSSPSGHVNMGVMNYWFYLLAEGGSGTNGKSFSYNVTGIGKSLARQLVFESMVNYFPLNLDYSDAKNATIWCAYNLYGSCSFELEQVIKAWDAVGVSSDGGIYTNGAIDCNDLNTVHNVNGNPYVRKIIQNLSVNCPISNNGVLVEFSAGKKVTMSPGFTSGTNYRAYIDACFQQIQVKLAPERADPEPVTSQLHESLNHLSVYPNPGNGMFYVSAMQGGRIRIFDVKGTLVFDQILSKSPQKLEIDLREYQSGLFLIELTTDKGERYTEKLVKS